MKVVAGLLAALAMVASAAQMRGGNAVLNLAALQGSLQGGLQGLPNAALEATLLAALSSQKVTPGLQPLLDQVSVLVVNMTNTVKSNAKSTQQQLDALATFTCTFPTAVATAADTSKVVSAKADGTKCSTEEKAALDDLNAALKARDDATAEKDKACNLFNSMQKQCSCDSPAGETVEAFSLRMMNFYSDMNKDVKSRKQSCDDKTKALDQAKADVDTKRTTYNTKQASCIIKQAAVTTAQDAVDATTCSAYKLAQDACTDYDTCFANGLAKYNTFKVTAQGQEAGYKVEMGSLPRLKCLVESLGKPDDQRQAAIEACQKQDFSAEVASVTLTYKTPPQKQTNCASTLPACTAKCCGTQAPSITNTVSPDKDCSCQSIDLQGKPWAPGALVKCTGTGCREVKQSTEVNSCPPGWKIFSPQSRSDWQTLIDLKVLPLGNPHFIVDVTRKQDGCGGCTGSPMNSNTAAQSSWVTTDGSPWWLRSSQFSEPNGDYVANCYLLLYDFSNADDIKFNDANCNYRSSHYFCQPTKSLR